MDAKAEPQLDWAGRDLVQADESRREHGSGIFSSDPQPPLDKEFPSH